MAQTLLDINYSTLNITQDNQFKAFGGKYTHSENLDGGIYKADGQGDTPSFAINAIDIDWNGAVLGTVNGINLGTIKNTSDLLKSLITLANAINSTSTEPTTYTVQFSNDGGSVGAPSMLQVTEGAQITLPGYTGSKSGYQQPTKWIDMNTQTAYNFGSTYTVTQNTIFKVQWIPVTYTVTVNVTNGTPSTQTNPSALSGSSIVFPITPNSGYQLPNTVSGATVDKTNSRIVVSNVNSNMTINVVCEPIQQEEYYWYAGQTQPSSISGTPTVDDTNFTNNKWHTLSTSQISKTITGGTSGITWKVAVPTTKSFKFYDNTLSELDTTWNKQSTGITVNGISYDIWISTSTPAKTNIYMK